MSEATYEQWIQDMEAEELAALQAEFDAEEAALESELASDAGNDTTSEPEVLNLTAEERADFDWESYYDRDWMLAQDVEISYYAIYFGRSMMVETQPDIYGDYFPQGPQEESVQFVFPEPEEEMDEDDMNDTDCMNDTDTDCMNDTDADSDSDADADSDSDADADADSDDTLDESFSEGARAAYETIEIRQTEALTAFMEDHAAQFIVSGTTAATMVDLMTSDRNIFQTIGEDWAQALIDWPELEVVVSQMPAAA